MLLSILIPTQPHRFNLLNRLQNQLLPQVEKYPGQIEILYHDGGKSYTTGEKRNNLISRAEGKYTVFIDDDDNIAPNYISSIMEAIKSGPDVITFNGWMTTDGTARVDFIIKLGEAYEERGGKYYRFPNHLCPMLREVASRFQFPHKTQQEDYEWACMIESAKALKTSVHIDEEIYHYEFVTNK